MFDFNESAQFCGVMDGEPMFGSNGGFNDACQPRMNGGLNLVYEDSP